MNKTEQKPSKMLHLIDVIIEALKKHGVKPSTSLLIILIAIGAYVLHTVNQNSIKLDQHQKQFQAVHDSIILLYETKELPTFRLASDTLRGTKFYVLDQAGVVREVQRWKDDNWGIQLASLKTLCMSKEGKDFFINETSKPFADHACRQL